MKNFSVHRRQFFSGCATAVGITAAARQALASNRSNEPKQALVAITLDLEMSRQYPTRDQFHWDYEKGNLDEATKRYASEAARRVADRGGRIHFFALGQTMEQEDVSWLKEIAEAGHPIGNHSYDHVNVTATEPDAIQFRFQRAPWLIEGKRPDQVIAENIRMADRALRSRLGIEIAGFRTPGGFHEGIAAQPHVQNFLLEHGYHWVSSKYPAHPSSDPGTPPDEGLLNAIVAAQQHAQPFRYPSGLVEVPMSPISDVGAFRTSRWPLEAFLESIRRCLAWTIDHGTVFDFLAHPSCLVVEDPEFRAIELICDLVTEANDRAALVDLGTIAARANG